MNPQQNFFHSMTMCAWNAQNIVNKKGELIDFVLENDVDILFIGETHLNASQTFNIPNYRAYRCDRTRSRGGGVLLLIKDCIPSCLVNSDNSQQYEYVAVRTKFQKYGEITIIAMYNPPRNTLRKRDIRQLFPLRQKTILAGDLNAKHQAWGCNATNKNGKKLNKLIEREGLFIKLPDQPTYLSLNFNHRPEYLDYVITNFHFNCNLYTINDLSSDHLPVLIYTDDSVEDKKKTIQITDWVLYKNTLIHRKLKNKKLHTISDIDKEVQRIQRHMSKAKQTSTTTRHVHHNYLKLPPELKDLIRLKNRQRKFYKRTQNPADKTKLNHLIRTIKLEVQQYRNTQWAETLASLALNEKKLWALTKALRNTRNINRPIHGPNGLVYDDEDKTEVFADSLELQFTENAEPNDILHEEQTLHENYTYFQENNIIDTTTIPCVYTREIMEQIKRLKRKKAPGKDAISNEMIRELPVKYIARLATIFNRCLALGYFPTAWKQAITVLFPKPNKDPAFAANHRPISLLACLGKLFEKIIYNRIKPHLDFIPNYQFGFREKRGTDQQLIRVADYIVDAKARNMHTAMVSIDFEKAFDKTSHPGILNKLIKHKLPHYLIVLLKSYLNNRSFQVKYNKYISTSRPIKASVSQGSILGPTLFIIYTADFPTWTDHNSLIAMYADDTILLQRSWDPSNALDKLQDKLDDVEEWCEQWRTKINGAKSQLIIFNRKKNNKRTNKYLEIFNDRVENKTSVGYLGITFNKRLNWGEHIQRSICKANAMQRRLEPLIGIRSTLDIKLKRKLYLTIIRPIITYASPVWSTATDTQLKSLQTFQNKIVKKIAKAPWYIRRRNIHKDLNIPQILDFIDKLNVKFCTRNIHLNSAIADVIIYSATARHNRDRPLIRIAERNQTIRNQMIAVAIERAENLHPGETADLQQRTNAEVEEPPTTPQPHFNSVESRINRDHAHTGASRPAACI